METQIRRQLNDVKRLKYRVGRKAKDVHEINRLFSNAESLTKRGYYHQAQSEISKLINVLEKQ